MGYIVMIEERTTSVCADTGRAAGRGKGSSPRYCRLARGCSAGLPEKIRQTVTKVESCHDQIRMLY